MSSNLKYNPLDKIIAEQATYYGLTVEKYITASDKLAQLQELIDESVELTQTQPGV